MALLGTGALLTFVTSAFSCEILRIKKSGNGVPSIKTTSMNSTTDTFLPGKVKNPGTMEFEIQFDPDARPTIGVAETIRITYPKKASGSAAGHKSECSGFVEEISDEIPLEDKIVATIKVQFSGAWTETAEV